MGSLGFQGSLVWISVGEPTEPLPICYCSGDGRHPLDEICLFACGANHHGDGSTYATRLISGTIANNQFRQSRDQNRRSATCSRCVDFLHFQ